MARKKTTRISRGQMPHPLVWYIRFREEGSDSEVAKRYFTTLGKISDIRQNKTFRHITENAAFSESDIDKARNQIKKNFTKNSDEVALKDAEYCLEKLDEIKTGKTNFRKTRQNSAGSRHSDSSSAITERQETVPSSVTTATAASAADAEKADKREEVSEELKGMGVTRDTDVPEPPPRSSLLNVRAEFIFVALAVVFLVVFLAIFSDDDIAQQPDDTAITGSTEAVSSDTQTDDSTFGAQLPAMTSPPTTGKESVRQGPPSVEGSAPIAEAAEKTRVISASQQNETAAPADKTGEDRLPTPNLTDSDGSADDPGQQPAFPETDITATKTEPARPESAQDATPGTSGHVPAPYLPGAAAILPPRWQDTTRSYILMPPPHQASAYNRWYSPYQVPQRRQTPPRSSFQPPSFQPPPPPSQRRPSQPRPGWQW